MLKRVGTIVPVLVFAGLALAGTASDSRTTSCADGSTIAPGARGLAQSRLAKDRPAQPGRPSTAAPSDRIGKGTRPAGTDDVPLWVNVGGVNFPTADDGFMGFDGTNFWTARLTNYLVQQVDQSGNLISQFSTSSYPLDATRVGNEIFVPGIGTTSCAVYDLYGGFLRTVFNSAGYTIWGMDWDGAKFWCTDPQTMLIYTMDLNGSVLQTFAGTNPPTWLFDICCDQMMPDRVWAHIQVGGFDYFTSYIEINPGAGTYTRLVDEAVANGGLDWPTGIAFQQDAGSGYVWSQFGNETYVWKNLVHAAPVPNDAGADQVLAPTGVIVPMTPMTPSCEIQNYGTNQISNIPVHIEVSQGGAPVYTGLTTYTPLLDPGATAVVTFSPDWTVTTGSYAVKAWTSLSGDGNLYNDTARGSGYAGITTKVMIADAEYPGYAQQLAPLLQAASSGKFSQVDEYNLSSYYGVATFPATEWYNNGYRAILTWSDYPYLDQVAAGDSMARFVELGGVVVDCFPVDLDVWGVGLGGRYHSQYQPFTYQPNYSSGTATMTVNHNPAHPIMAGVNALGDNDFWSYNTHSSLRSSNCVCLAEWSTGQTIAAYLDSSNLHAVSIGYFPTDGILSYLTGDWVQMLVNALAWVPAPGAFDLLTPANHAAGAPVAGTMTWQPAANAVAYYVYFDVFNPPTTARGRVTSPSYAFSGLANGTRYFWNVKAVNVGGGAQSVSTFDFTTTAAPGWVAQVSMPPGGKNKNIKDGADLTFAPRTISAEDLLYALKGNNRYEFYRYNLAENTWVTRESIPALNPDGKKKAVKKGALLVTGSDNNIYASKGNNTIYFWKYDPATGVWTTIDATVPSVTTSTRGLKEGSDAVAVGDYIYLLKGSGTTEFYRWRIGDPTWEMMQYAPRGWNEKPYKNGSRLAYDYDHNMIYVVKGSYNLLSVFDVARGYWTVKDSVPKIGTSGKKKKVKDGSGMAYANGSVFVLKGGNTNEFFAYSVATEQWSILADMPVISTSSKRVKGGGTLVHVPTTNALYAFRGNNTLQFWSYGLGTAYGSLPRANCNITSESEMVNLKPSIAIAPNPVTSAAVISYSLPRAGNVSLKLYDIAGTLKSTLAAGRVAAGSYSVAVSRQRLAAGVYVLKFATDGYETTRKLVLE